MRRIIHSSSVLIALQLVFGVAHLFAASGESNSDSANSGLVGAIVAVLIPTLALVGIGVGIYTWLRRKKPSFGRLFPQRKVYAPRDVSRHTGLAHPPSSDIPHRRSRRRGPEATTDANLSSEQESDTLESISLANLEQVSALREAGHIQQYYESIAMIIKRYVEEKYGIKTVDATTGQILAALPDDLTDVVGDHVGEILRMCDMVQFSRHRPTRAELSAMYQSTKEFLESQIVVSEDESDEEADEDDDSFGDYRQLM